MPLQSSSLSPIAHPISIVVSVDKQKYYILLWPKQAKIFLFIQYLLLLTQLLLQQEDAINYCKDFESHLLTR